MRLAYLLLALAGVAVIAWGLPASHRLKKPWDIAAAVMVLVGLIAALFGTLLFMAPRFFQG